MMTNCLVLLCVVIAVVESNWVVDWSDDFDGTAGSAPNSAYWTNTRYSIGKQLQCYDSDYAYLDGDGHLVLKTEYVGPFECPGEGTMLYKSGVVTGHNLKDNTGGKWEIIAKLPDPSYTRLHSSIWLQKSAGECYQEVDIVEYWPGKTYPAETCVETSYHYQKTFKPGCGGGPTESLRYYYPDDRSPWNEIENDAIKLWNTSYHNFTFVWRENEYIAFYIDGAEIERGRVTPTSPTPKNATTGNTLPWQPMHLIMNTAVCNKTDCNQLKAGSSTELKYGPLITDPTRTAYFYIDSVTKYDWITPSLPGYTHTVSSNGNYIGVEIADNNAELSWSAANDYCINSIGTQLATIRDLADQSEIEGLLSTAFDQSNYYVWIGWKDYNGLDVWSPCTDSDCTASDDCSAEDDVDGTWHSDGDNLGTNDICGVIGIKDNRFGKWYGKTCEPLKDFICNHYNGPKYGTDNFPFECNAPAAQNDIIHQINYNPVEDNNDNNNFWQFLTICGIIIIILSIFILMLSWAIVSHRKNYAFSPIQNDDENEINSECNIALKE